MDYIYTIQTLFFNAMCLLSGLYCWYLCNIMHYSASVSMSLCVLCIFLWPPLALLSLMLCHCIVRTFLLLVHTSQFTHVTDATTLIKLSSGLYMSSLILGILKSVFYLKHLMLRTHVVPQPPSRSSQSTQKLTVSVLQGWRNSPPLPLYWL